MLGDEPKTFYDYSLIEAEDFPREFFRLVYAVTEGDHVRPTYFAYDELQSVSSVEVSTAHELFNSDANGLPLIPLEDEYAGPIERILCCTSPIAVRAAL